MNLFRPRRPLLHRCTRYCSLSPSSAAIRLSDDSSVRNLLKVHFDVIKSVQQKVTIACSYKKCPSLSEQLAH